MGNIESDRAFAEAIRGGDETASSRFCNDYYLKLLPLARHALPERADDLTQTVLAICLENLKKGKYRGEAPLVSYVFGVFRNARKKFLTDLIRSREMISVDDVAHRLRDHTDNPVRELLQRERLSILKKCLAKLNDLCREVLALTSTQAMKHAEVAERLGIPIGTMSRRVHDCRKKLVAEARELMRARVTVAATSGSKGAGTELQPGTGEDS